MLVRIPLWISIIFLSVCVIYLCSCGKNNNSYIKDLIINNIEKGCSKNHNWDSCYINIKNVIEFDWDYMYIFEEYTESNEISDFLELDCSCDYLDDGQELIIFVKGKKIVYKEKNHVASRGYAISFYQLRKNGYTKINSNSSSFLVLKKERVFTNGYGYAFIPRDSLDSNLNKR